MKIKIREGQAGVIVEKLEQADEFAQEPQKAQYFV